MACWTLSLSSGATLGAGVSPALGVAVPPDTLTLADAHAVAADLVAAALQPITLSDVLTAAYPLAATTNATLSSAVTVALVRALTALDTWRILTTTGAVADQAVGLAETLGIGADLGRRLLGAVADGLTLTGAPPTIRLVPPRLAESMGVSEALSGTLTVLASLLEGWAARAVLGLADHLDAAETVTLTEAIARAIRSVLTTSSTLTLATAVEQALIVVRGANEALTLDDDTAALATHLLAADERFAFLRHLPLLEGDFQGWVINTDSLGVTHYAQFPLRALVSHQGATYGITDTGLYTLTGDDDDGAPIVAAIRTGDLTFGTSLRKGIPRAYLYVRHDGDLLLKTCADTAEHWYRIAGRPDQPDVAVRRVKLGRGVRAEAWAIEITNVDGADFDLRGCEVLPVILTRRF